MKNSKNNGLENDNLYVHKYSADKIVNKKLQCFV